MSAAPTRNASDGGSEPPAEAILVTVCGHTEVGRVREHNEDGFVVQDLARGATAAPGASVTWRVEERGILLAVCDGMGVAAAGEDASRLAVEIVSRTMQEGAPLR